jgi:anthranilate synthase/aminodeoxychorismate synthase-like glutamine amidotransferase
MELKNDNDASGPNILIIDNYDSFTYNLYDYLVQTGADCVVLRNNTFTIQYLQALNFQAIVLSPGPKKPEDAGLLMEVISHYYDVVPILGICLGHQALGVFFGANLVKAALPVHGKTSRITHNGHWLFDQVPTEFDVMRYHSLILKSLKSTPLECLAVTDEGEVMAIAHKTLPLVGLQFHPESILTEHGHLLLRNWVASIPPI